MSESDRMPCFSKTDGEEVLDFYNFYNISSMLSLFSVILFSVYLFMTKGEEINTLRLYDYDEKLLISICSDGQDFCRVTMFFFLKKKYTHAIIEMTQIIMRSNSMRTVSVLRYSLVFNSELRFSLVFNKATYSSS